MNNKADVYRCCNCGTIQKVEKNSQPKACCKCDCSDFVKDCGR